MRESWGQADRFIGTGEPVAAESGTYEHDLFVVHAAADAPFVHGQLLPALGLAPERVLLSCALRLGEPIDARLLTLDGDLGHDDARIDLAHEVMISAWPTLAGWIQAWCGDEQRRRQLEAAAASWKKHGCGASGLLDAVELVEADAWRQTASARDLGDSDDVVALVAASRAALQDAEHQEAAAREAGPAETNHLQQLLALSYQFLCLAQLLTPSIPGGTPSVSDNQSRCAPADPWGSSR